MTLIFITINISQNMTNTNADFIKHFASISFPYQGKYAVIPMVSSSSAPYPIAFRHAYGVHFFKYNKKNNNAATPTRKKIISHQGTIKEKP